MIIVTTVSCVSVVMICMAIKTPMPPVYYYYLLLLKCTDSLNFEFGFIHEN